MNIGRILEGLIRNVKTAKRVAYGILFLTVVIDVFIHREHPVFIWDHIPGFSAVYGFISCVLIIVVSKVLGHYWLMKREDYYD